VDVDAADINLKDRFHEALGVAIPSLVRLLSHWEVNARSAAVSVIRNIAKHSELKFSVDMDIADIDVKTRFMRHWGSPFHRFSRCLNTRIATSDRLLFL
jgi:hypothetical protein